MEIHGTARRIQLNREAMYNGIIDSFYEIGTESEKWTTVLDSVASFYGAVGSDLHLIRKGAQQISYMGGDVGHCVDEYVERFLHKEPRSLFLLRAKPGEVITDLHITSAAFMKKSEYYSDFLVRQGMEHCIAAAPLQSDTAAAYLGIHLRRGGGAPTDQQMNDVRRMQVHLHRVIRTQLNLIEAGLNNSLFSEAFNNLAVGLVVLGNDGNVLVSNEAAENFLRNGDVVKIHSNKLVTGSSCQTGELEGTIADIVKHNGNRSSSLMLTDYSGNRIAVTVTRTTGEFRDSTGATAYVFLHDLQTQDPANEIDQLIHLFSLTPAEARVAQLIALGLSTHEAAERAGVTYETMRSTLKAVFAKCKVKRQSELVALIHKSSPLLKRSVNRT